MNMNKLFRPLITLTASLALLIGFMPNSWADYYHHRYYRGYAPYYGGGYYNNGPSRVGSILGGAGIGAAAGAGLGYITDKPILPSALVGGAAGGVIQTIRTSRWF